MVVERWKALVLGAALLGGVAGCSGGAKAQELTIDASEYKFGVTGNAVPGSNLITLKNSGKEVHHVQLVHIAAGKTMNDLAAALQAGDLSKVPGKFEGGVGQLAPGGSGQLEATLSEGQYALLCFVPGADGAPHFAKGMSATIDVKGEPNKATFGAAKVKVTGRDYAFDAPETAKAGSTSIEFTNGGKEPHEANIFKLASGVTVQQALQALAAEGQPASGPPPFTPMGGAQGILPGAKTEVVANLEKGEYVFVCFIPDATNTPHVAKGMVKSLKVE